MSTTQAQQDPIEGYTLIKIAKSKAPIWFIIKDRRHHVCGKWQTDEDTKYLVEEHTCPTNLIPVEAIIEAHGEYYDPDPHGVLEFVAWRPRPEGLAEGQEPDDWRDIFPEMMEEPK